ncbi:MAG: PDGLE domain-containing protein [Desulfitobacteriia bacterium]|jgi:cobalt/nickel transport protein
MSPKTNHMQRAAAGVKKEIMIGLLIALVVVVFLAPFASSSPDGLERVAEDHAFLDQAEGREVILSPLPDYEMPGIANKTLAGILAGLTGTLLTFIAMLLAARLILAWKMGKKSNQT